jgi:hypothetical protein
VNEFFQRLNYAKVRYLLIGGQAMRLFGMPRYSMDWDIFVPAHDLENFARINKEFENELDMEVEPLGPLGQGFVQTFQTQWGIVQFHLVVPGVTNFEAAESRAKVHHTNDNIQIRSLCGEDLLAAKQAADRPVDQSDLLFLKELKKLGRL